MEYLEAMTWLTTMDLAKKGSKEEQERLRVENERRAENGLPTIEEEMNALIEKGRKIKAERK